MARLGARLEMAVVALLIATAIGGPTRKLESKNELELCALAMGYGANESVNMHSTCSVAVLAGGSFLRLSRVLQSAAGVIKAVKGYTGGFGENPTFEDVTRGTTGHAESVLVVFNDKLTTYDDIVAYFLNHHASTADGVFRASGIDDAVHVGTQFRSTVWVLNPRQKKGAEQAKARRAQAMNATIATTIEEFGGVFYVESGRSDLELLRVRATIEKETANATSDPSVTVARAVVPEQTQGAGKDDSVAVEASKLDVEGKLFGAAKAMRLRKRNIISTVAPSNATTVAANTTTPPPPPPETTTTTTTTVLPPKAKKSDEKDGDAAVDDVTVEASTAASTTAAAKA